MSVTATEAPSIREAESPFDSLDADIILRSVDGVNFRTYKSYLTRALHGFDDLLHAGHLNGIGGVEEMQNGALIIPLPESSNVLDLFLRTLYPVEFGCPALSGHLNLMPGVCKALSKYCVKNFPFAISDALLLAAEKEPEHVYVISCRYAALIEVSKVAAKKTLRKARRLDNLPDSVVAEISGLQYHALTKYQISCRAAAVKACNVDELPSDFARTPGARALREPDQNSNCNCMRHHNYLTLQDVYGPPDDLDVDMVECSIPEWLVEYLADVQNDLAKGEEICGSVAFRPKHLSKAVEAGKGCDVCSTNVMKLIEFAGSLKWSIDADVSRVVFEGSAVAA